MRIKKDRNKPNKKLSIKYEKDTYWYDNTYDMLGSNWLYDALKKLNLKTDFTFLSPSANIGRYEREAYDTLVNDGYKPTFYVSDIGSGKLEKKAEEIPLSFIWIDGEGTDASKIRISENGGIGTVPDPVDVILDCKGAIWHTIDQKSSKKNNPLKETIELLENYYNLLKTDDSVLLIDYAMPEHKKIIGYFYTTLYYSFRDIRHHKVKMHYMAEHTTAFLLSYYLGEDITSKAFIPLHIDLKGSKIKENFDLATCTKKDLKHYIEELKTISRQTFNENIKKYKSYLNLPLLTIFPIFLFLLYISFEAMCKK